MSFTDISWHLSYERLNWSLDFVGDLSKIVLFKWSVEQVIFFLISNYYELVLW